MEPAVRAQWLAEIERTNIEIVPLLKKLLATHDAAERAGELETVPKLAPPPPSSAFQSGEMVGAYRLLRPLGRGGMGEVWLADQADGRVIRQVALKLPTQVQHLELWRRRFQLERDILAKLAHPNIAHLFDAGVDDTLSRIGIGQPYLALEYVEGQPLNEYVDAKSLPLRARLELFQQVLAAAAHAHQHLVVHRDLKPSNILVTADGEVKLLDFGIAKLLGHTNGENATPDLTQLGSRMMTLRYAAPEQLTDGMISTATDTYALGVILHELVTGLSPYRAVREQTTLTETAMLSDAISVPSSLLLTASAATARGFGAPKLLARAITGDLDAIILKALRRNPADRYTAMAQFDDDIQRHLESRPVKAREGTWRYLASRFVARYKLPIAAAAAVFFTMVVGVVMVEQQRRVALAEKARAEKHFASVRKLANSFMFDVHGEIIDLPGSLKARELLIKTSLQYLDVLANEATIDQGLAAELAAAYQKIATIQGAPGQANLGMVAESLANYEKSKQLFVGLGDYKIDDITVQREHLNLRYLLGRAYAQNRDPRWQENIAAGVALAERVASMRAATPADRVRMASMLGEQASLTNILIGASPDVEAMMLRAITLLESLLKEVPDLAVARESLAGIYDRAATIFTNYNGTPQRFAQAIEMRRKAILIFSSMAVADPNVQKYASSETETLSSLAQDLTRARRFDEAEQTIARALQLNRAMVAKDPKNMDHEVAVVANLAAATEISYGLGNYANAISLGREGLASYRALPKEVQQLLAVRVELSGVNAYLGLALNAASLNVGSPQNRRAVHREACAMLADSVKVIDELRAAKIVFHEADAAERIDGNLRCQSELATSSGR